MKTDLGSSVAGESAFITLLIRTVGVKGPIVTVWRVVRGGACVDVHAADIVIDSDCLAWSSTTCKKFCCKELTVSLSLQVAQTISCSSEYM